MLIHCISGSVDGVYRWPKMRPIFCRATPTSYLGDSAEALRGKEHYFPICLPLRFHIVAFKVFGTRYTAIGRTELVAFS